MRISLRPIVEQVIVITGATSGIGLVTARAAAARGARVWLVARNEAALRELTQAIAAAGGEAGYSVADVGDADQVEAAARAALACFGRIDSWVSNAGVAIYGKLVDTPLAEHERMFRTNYFGTVNSAMTAVRHLRASGGALIVVGSIASDLPSPLLGAYAASKHAIKGYISSLRIELHADAVPISISLVKPSGTATPIAAHAANHIGHAALVPPPAYDPALVAEAILHCAAHPRRELTVGGVGRAQVIVGTHFPTLLDHAARLMMPLLMDRSRPPGRTDALFAPTADGDVQGDSGSGRRVSLYSAAARRPGATAIGLAALVGAGTAAWMVRRRA
jgi:short-subunit dehydrogenase